jgi:alcohol dehydrogenase class IV
MKVSLRSVLMLPRVALIDPELTYDLPPSLTASTGLDALTQLIESYVSPQANLLTDMFCREGLQRASRSLRRAYDVGRDVDAREDMALASLYGGLALANAKLGAVHGLAAPIGGMYKAPHGAVCARLLPCVVHVNVRAIKARGVPSEALRRYDEIAQMLTGYANASAPDSVVWLGGLCREFQIPPLSEYGLVEGDYDEIVSKTARSSSMQGNPIPLSPQQLREILEKAS